MIDTAALAMKYLKGEGPPILELGAPGGQLKLLQKVRGQNTRAKGKSPKAAGHRVEIYKAKLDESSYNLTSGNMETDEQTGDRR